MPWNWRRQPPSEDTLKQVAQEIYQNRMLLNRPGTAHEDWVTAEKIVHSPLKTTLFASHRPLIQLEKRVWEPLLAWADNQALLSLLGIIGNVGIILAVFTFIGTEKQRRDAEVLNAWQTLTSAHGQSGSGGRIQALEFLNASPGANWRRRVGCLWLCTWPAERLDGINLSVESNETSESEEAIEESQTREELGVYLVGIRLPNASLREANLEGASLWGANLEGAHLWGANLAEADLERANLTEAELWDANLAEADLERANLTEAELWNANLAGALLGRANLTGTEFWDANLQRAELREANLEGADLRDASLAGSVLEGANLEGAHLGRTNLAGAVLVEANLEGARLGRTNLAGAVLGGASLAKAKRLTQSQLSDALLCLTTLPENITLDSNRDCEAMGIDPETGRWIPSE